MDLSFDLWPNNFVSTLLLAEMPTMGRRCKIAVSMGLMALLLFVVWLAFPGRVAPRGLRVGFTTNQITVAWVTNISLSAIRLEEPYVQFENMAGRLVRDQGSSWNQKGYEADLRPGSVAWLANGFDGDRKRLRFVFEYQRDGGPFLRAFSKAIGVLPLNRYGWLHRNGMVDGVVHDHYEGPWIANPQSGANGRQRSGSDTNQTSTVAASRRSP